MSGRRLGLLPRNWERAYGYAGSGRYVAFYWTPFGDDALYDDGREVGVGQGAHFQILYVSFPALDRYNVGAFDREAGFWLVLDRQTRQLRVCPRAEAEAQVQGQWRLAYRREGPVLDWRRAQELLTRPDSLARVVSRIRPCRCADLPTPGWVLAEDGGLDPCPECGGWGFAPALGELIELAMEIEGE